MEWRDVKGWEEFYQISNTGEVRSKDRRIVVLDPWGEPGERNYRGRVLRKGKTPKGYELVSFTAPGRKRRYAYVHDLIAEAFIGPKPPGLEVCHDDGVPWHNWLYNLRYDTRAANSADRHRHGTMDVYDKGEAHRCAVLTEAAVHYIRAVRPHVTLQELADRYGVSTTTISMAEHGKTWRHI